MTNKSSRKPTKDEIQSTIELKTKLQDFLGSANSPFSIKFIKTEIESLEKKISQLSSIRNAGIVRDQVKNLETLQGSFSQIGMWNVKSKLFPRPSDPPMAKLDSHGNLITSQEALK